MGYYLFIPEAGSLSEIKILRTTGKQLEYPQWKLNLQIPNCTADIVIFGPEQEYVAAFDDEGILKDQKSTVEINGHILHGNVCIYSQDAQGYMAPLKEKDVKYLITRLRLLKGHKTQTEPHVEFQTFSSHDDMMEALDKISEEKQRINTEQWE